MTYRLLFIFAVFFCEVPIAAAAVSSRVQAEYKIGLRPAGEANVSGFDISRLLLAVQPDNWDRVSLEFEAGRSVSNEIGATAANDFFVRVRLASVQVNDHLEVGMVANPWVEAHEKLLGLAGLGSFSEMTERQFGVQAFSDLGLNYFVEFPKGQLSFSVYNGSGNGSKETGMSKDSQVVFLYRINGWSLIASHVRGFYDNLPKAVAKKNRTRIGLSADWQVAQLYFYQIAIEDNAAQAKQANMFVGAHLSETAPLFKSLGHGGLLRIRFLKNQSLYYRRVHWDVEKSFKDNDIVDQVAGWTLTGEVEWGVNWHSRDFGKKFMNGVTGKDSEESVFLTLGADF